ncbi:MAG: asparagine synthase (glutamine-hydrolyzing) [Deltaproteobacteria bacterium]|nr:asparagine synthase (glutamine-hydrolyzing) [Deltaproteobacteria bacterium]
MCGITGILNYQQEYPVEPEILRAMCRTLTHRGPDDEGYYLNGNVGLAMRRLSIIDLNTGRQPIHNEDRTVWTAFNGEIYNFPELRRELLAKGHTFYTSTDTEVIVHLYEEYGVDFPAHLSGMFAIALWDEKPRRLMLVRDRLGIKPLYYALLPDRLLWGSEIKAILAEGLKPTLDFQALSHYLSLLYIPAPYSIYQEINKLEPGHALVWQDGRAAIRSYWDLAQIDPRDANRLKWEDIKSALHSLLLETVRSHLISDVPLGVFLSGGLDSSTVVAMMRQVHHGAIKTFSIGFNEPSYDERSYARLVARQFETEHTELQVTPDAADLVHQLVHYFDEPFADSSAIPTFYLSQLTRRHVTVALGGDGGDEIFAGYATYQADKLAQIYGLLPGFLSEGLIPRLVQSLPVSDRKVSFDFKARRFVESACLEPQRRHYAWKAFFNEDLKRSLLNDDIISSLNGSLDSFPVYSRHSEAVRHWDDLNRFQYADLKVYLPDDILVKVDRMSMAHSLEVRVPLLDHRLVEFMFQLPGPMKMPGLRLKHLLKETMRGILPKEILKKPKGGFNVPMSRWLKTSLRPLLEEYLSPGMIKRQGCFNPGSVRRLLADHLAGRADYSRNLWALLNFSIWASDFR